MIYKIVGGLHKHYKNDICGENGYKNNLGGGEEPYPLKYEYWIFIHHKLYKKQYNFNKKLVSS